MKPPEIAGGGPLPLFPALVGKTWYQGGGAIVAYVAPEDRDAFETSAREAGYVVEGVEDGGAIRKLRIAVRKA